jgi:hypothetical protein
MSDLDIRGTRFVHFLGWGFSLIDNFQNSQFPTRHRVRYVLGVLSANIKRPERDADGLLHSALRFNYNSLTPKYLVYVVQSCMVARKYLTLQFDNLFYSLTSRVVLEKLTGSQPAKNFPAFYGNRRFTTIYTNVRYLFLSWARLTPSVTPSNFMKIHLMFSSDLRLWHPSGFSLRFFHKNPLCISPVPHICYLPLPSHCSRFYHPKFIWRGVHIIKLRTV